MKLTEWICINRLKITFLLYTICHIESNSLHKNGLQMIYTKRHSAYLFFWCVVHYTQRRLYHRVILKYYTNLSFFACQLFSQSFCSLALFMLFPSTFCVSVNNLIILVKAVQRLDDLLIFAVINHLRGKSKRKRWITHPKRSLLTTPLCLSDLLSV